MIYCVDNLVVYKRVWPFKERNFVRKVVWKYKIIVTVLGKTFACKPHETYCNARIMFRAVSIVLKFEFYSFDNDDGNEKCRKEFGRTSPLSDLVWTSHFSYGNTANARSKRVVIVLVTGTHKEVRSRKKTNTFARVRLPPPPSRPRCKLAAACRQSENKVEEFRSNKRFLLFHNRTECC